MVSRYFGEVPMWRWTDDQNIDWVFKFDVLLCSSSIEMWMRLCYVWLFVFHRIMHQINTKSLYLRIELCFVTLMLVLLLPDAVAITIIIIMIVIICCVKMWCMNFKLYAMCTVLPDFVDMLFGFRLLAFILFCSLFLYSLFGFHFVLLVCWSSYAISRFVVNGIETVKLGGANHNAQRDLRQHFPKGNPMHFLKMLKTNSGHIQLLILFDALSFEFRNICYSISAVRVLYW